MFRYILYLPLFISFGAMAQTCNSYIDDNWADARYTVETDSTNGDITVLDTVTSLMWKNCAQGLSGASCTTGNAQSVDWAGALAIPANENYASNNDWRLPNINELMSLVAFNCEGPAINETIFPNADPSGGLSHYWSSTPRAPGNNARAIFIGSGAEAGLPHANNNGNNYVRLVRTN